MDIPIILFNKKCFLGKNSLFSGEIKNKSGFNNDIPICCINFAPDRRFLFSDIVITK